jgi:GT2 family glycosyltransferase
MANFKLSIAIPVFNKFNFTKSCLKDLSYLDTSDHQIIVVDNGSTDETQPEIEKLLKTTSNLTYIRLEENYGFGFACNKGFVKASAPNVMFLNNDIRVFSKLPNWTDVYIGALEEEPNQLLSPTGGCIDTKREFQFLYETEGDRKFNYLSGWMLASSKETFNKLKEGNNEGPFNSEIYFSYFEDTHLGFLATKLGIPMKILSNGAVSHFGKITSRQINTAKLYSDSRKKFLEVWSKK